MKTLFIVYHDPGVKLGESLVEILALELKAIYRGKLGIKPIRISVLEEGENPFGEDDYIFGLLPFRGGHLHLVETMAKESGSTFLGKIPNEVIVEGIYKEVSQCNEVSILYWPAKRFVEAQREDLNYICEGLRKMGFDGGINLYPIYEEVYRGCIVVTSVFPGRLTLRAREAGARVAVPYLFCAIKEPLIRWLEGNVILTENV